MVYGYTVKKNGKYYAAGENVPDDFEETPDFKDSEITLESGPHAYTEDELREMPVREIRQIASDKGIAITKTLKDDVIREFLEKQF